MLDKKQIQVIFLFKFKTGHKAAEITCNINNAFGPGIANKPTGQWWFKKFCKEDQNLEDKEYSDQPSEVDNGQRRAIIEAAPLTREVDEEPNVKHSMVLWHLKQSRKVKKLDKWATTNQTKKKNILKCCVILCKKNKPFLDQIVICNKKWI